MREESVNGGDIRRAPVSSIGEQGKKGTYQDYKRLSGITDDLPDEERFERLSCLAKKFALCAGKILDNCTPDQLNERLKDPNVPVTEEDMQLLACQAERAVGLVRACLNEMDTIPLSQMNGTSIVYQGHLEVLNAQEAILVEARDVIEAARKARGLEPSFVCKLVAMAFMSFAAFFSDYALV